MFCLSIPFYVLSVLSNRVAEPKLFFSAPAPAPTFNKFPLRLRSWLRLRLELWGCLFSQLLNEKVDFLWFLERISTFDPILYELWLNNTTLVCPGAGAGSRSRNFSIPAPAPAPAKSFGSGSVTLLSKLEKAVWKTVQKFMKAGGKSFCWWVGKIFTSVRLTRILKKNLVFKSLT
jgi:hypothetical protein